MNQASRETADARPIAASAASRFRVPSALITVAAVLLAFVAGGGLILVAGVSPLRAYRDLLLGAFGSQNGLAETLVKTTPLLLAGLGTAIAYRARLLNIGAEGQIYIGAIGAASVGLYLGPLSPAVGLPLVLLAGFVGGALWAGLAAVARLRFRASELITTLMLNYVALQIVSYLISGPWKDPSGSDAFTALITPGARVPILLPGTRLHAGILVGLAAAACLWFVLRHTVFGYQLTVAGANEQAAEYAGIPTGRLVLTTLLISGGLAGLAGAIEMAGVHHRLLDGLSPGYGYTAIAIAMLGQGEPLGVLAAAFLLAALANGGDAMQQLSRVPVPLIAILQGLVLLCVLCSELLRVRRQTEQRKQEGA